MAEAVRAKEGEMLDWICWHYYGTAAAIVAVLEANPGLADIGQPVPAGTLDEAPDAAPLRNIFWDSRAPWFVPTSELPHHAELPEGA